MKKILKMDLSYGAIAFGAVAECHGTTSLASYTAP
jgi:hypothetical protein